MTDAPDAAWAEVGRRLQHRIFTELRLTKAEFIRRSGISDKTLDGYLAGRPIIRGDKARALCDAVGWSQDSIDRIRDGKEPLEVTAAATRPESYTIDDRMDALERKLEDVLRQVEAERAENQRLRAELIAEQKRRRALRGEPNGEPTQQQPA